MEASGFERRVAEVRRFKAGDRVIPVYVPDWVRGGPKEENTRRRLGGPLTRAGETGRRLYTEADSLSIATP